jgi:hypothetical protein
MELSTIIIMVVILGFIWGGFFYLVKLAYKKEKLK